MLSPPNRIPNALPHSSIQNARIVRIQKAKSRFSSGLAPKILATNRAFGTLRGLDLTLVSEFPKSNHANQKNLQPIGSRQDILKCLQPKRALGPNKRIGLVSEYQKQSNTTFGILREHGMRPC